MSRRQPAISTFALVTRIMLGLGAFYVALRYGLYHRFPPASRSSMVRALAPLWYLWLTLFFMWGVLLWRWISALGAMTGPTTPAPSSLRCKCSGQQPPTTSLAVGRQPWSLELLRSIDWQAFERLCAAYFEALGFHAKTQSHGPDGGIDITLSRPGIPEYRGLAQCKAWNSNVVGSSQVREFFGVIAKENVDQGFYLITGRYAPAALQFAAGTHLHLTDGKGLLERILMLPPDKQQALLNIVTSDDLPTPRCAKCGAQMVQAGKTNWRCASYPGCRGTMRDADDAVAAAR